jgi:hypothetical protein
MAHSYHHAVSSARRFGGLPADYQAIHDFLDSSKATLADARHRALLHHAFGIFIAERVFGTTITTSTGRDVPVRLVAEQHIKEDCGGRIPTVQDWLEHLRLEPWMVQDAAAFAAAMRDATAALPPDSPPDSEPTAPTDTARRSLSIVETPEAAVPSPMSPAPPCPRFARRTRTASGVLDL